MLVYYGLFAYSVLLSVFYSRKSKNIFNLFIFLSIIFFAICIPALRGENVGTDTQMYVNFLTWDRSFTDWLTTIEIGNALIYSGINNFTTESYFIVFLTYSILTNIFIFLSIFKFSKNIPVSLMVLFGFNCFYFYQMNVMRQCLAVAITMWANVKLLNGEKNKAWFYYLFAIIFHYSAFFCLLFPFVFKLIDKYFYLMISFIVLFLCSISIFAGPIFDFVSSLGGGFSKYSHYSDSVNESGTGLKLFFLNLSVFLVITFITATKQKFNDKIYKFLFLLMVMCLTVQFCIAFLNLSAMSFGRIIQYCFFGFIFGMPYMLNSIKNKQKPLVYLLFFMFCAIYMYLFLEVAQTHMLVPYNTGSLS